MKNKTITYSKISLEIYDNNLIMFKLNKLNINWFYSLVKTKNKTIDTRNCKLSSITKKIKNNTCYIDITYTQDDLKLIQHFIIEKDKNYFQIRITLLSSKTIESNYLVPLAFPYPNSKANELFLSLEERMLLVPYDNDMWVYYESTPLAPGKTSYDLTAIYNDKNLNGLLIGALDFDIWKNGIRCNGYDARSFMAISGIADEYTHDSLSHGYLKDKKISSSRFICGYYIDIRDGLEIYGELAKNNNGIYHWKNGVPYGWNSYSALTLDTTIKHLHAAADYIYKDLKNFKSIDNVTYINFDEVENINEKDIKEFIDKLHSRKQKVGWYMNPVSHLERHNNIPLKGSNLKRKDILLKNIDGTNYPKIDDKYPVDITIPQAELDLRLRLREFVEMGFDYLKIDFLSHGALEGIRHNKNIKTGRQALLYFYNIVKEELDPNKVNKEIFISSSIDPLFPCGYSHSRRSSCDAFGHIEDVKYVLNALTYSWWTNNTLYQFNDPDHTVLYKSKVDARTITSKQEARSRYNASIISGSVMLLSDDYGPSKNKDTKQARLRAKQLANNKSLNAITKLNKTFKPLMLNNTSNIFYLNDKDNYLAVFNFENKDTTITINPKDINFKNNGKLLNLNTHKTLDYKNTITIKLKAYDSCILKAK